MITSDQVDKLKKYDIIFRPADGVWCSPICMGHFWIIEKIEDDQITYCWVPDGWEVSKYESETQPKSYFVSQFLEKVEAPYYPSKLFHLWEEQKEKTRYEQALAGLIWCLPCAKWHEWPVHGSASDAAGPTDSYEERRQFWLSIGKQAS